MQKFSNFYSTKDTFTFSLAMNTEKKTFVLKNISNHVKKSNQNTHISDSDRNQFIILVVLWYPDQKLKKKQKLSWTIKSRCFSSD